MGLNLPIVCARFLVLTCLCAVGCSGTHSVKPDTVIVPRTEYEQLKADLQSMSFVALGRKYGVSDNAIRKWLRWYEYEREAKAHENPPEATEGPGPGTIAA